MANTLNVNLNLNTSDFQRSLVRMQQSLSEFSRNMQRVGQDLTQNLSIPLLGVGAAAVKSFVDLDKLERGMTAVMGSSEAAAAELEKLKVSATAPGLGFKEAVRGSIRLQAVGLSADGARKTLETFGAAIAATGGTAQNLESVQYQLTQMISKNRILQEDFGILQENVPLLGKAVQAAFGTANIEQIRATGIGAKEFNDRLVEALATLPEVQGATGGLGNAFDNFGDSVKFSLSELGRVIAESINLEGILNGLSEGLASVVAFFKSLSPAAQKFVVILGAILAAVGTVLFILGKLGGLFATLASGFRVLIGLGPKLGVAFTVMTGPVGLAVLAILAAITAVGHLYDKFEIVRRIVNGVGQAFKELANLAKTSFSALVQGFAELKEGNFRKAADQFGKSLQVLNPIEQGKAIAAGFAVGFQDTTNYLRPTIDKIKKQIQSIQGGGVAPGLAPFQGTGGGTGEGGKLSPEEVKAAKELEIRISNITSRISELAQKAKGPFGLIRADLKSVAQLSPELNIQKDALLAYQKALNTATAEANLFGENPLPAQLSATKSALSNAISTFGPASEAVRVLADEYDRLTFASIELEEQTKKQQKTFALQQEVIGIIEQGLEGLVVSFSEFLGSIGSQQFNVSNLFGVLLGTISDTLIQLGKLAIATGIAVEGIKKALQTLNPIAAIVGGAALVALGSFVKSKAAGLTKLAKGGLAFGPTAAIVGDNPAARTDPEVIAPLSKLKDYLNPGGAGMIAEARISGNDLLILVNNAQRANNRIR